jgi:hypothetical protein
MKFRRFAAWRSSSSSIPTRSTKRHGAGTYIAEPARTMGQRDRVKILRPRVDALVTEARHLGVELGDVIKLLRERDAAIAKGVPK